MTYPDRLVLCALARIVLRLKQISGFDGPQSGAMFQDAARFRREYKECPRQAGIATNPVSRAQWLSFADEWLKQAQTAETLAKREADLPTCWK
ncbi:hypothetical protein ABIC01_000943 [Bradyrhizobium sp. RT4b]